MTDYLLHESYYKIDWNALYDFIYAYVQSFIIIKKEKIVDPMIDFNDYQILSNYDLNHMFQGWM